jgi:hypothetical protein
MKIQPTEDTLANQQKGAISDLNRVDDDHAKQTGNFQEPGEVSPDEMSISMLAERCKSEIISYRRGEPSNDRFAVELLRRATTQHDPLAWELAQQIFNEIVFYWMHGHPMRVAACHHDSIENYVAQTFTRFWQATVTNRELEFMTLTAALRYLRATLNSTILDTLRTYSQTTSLDELTESAVRLTEAREDDFELWEVVQSLIPEKRQRRVAYLLFHCHLKPREIVQYCSQEFDEVQEIYRLRRNIFDRLLRNADYIRCRLGTETCSNE